MDVSQLAARLKRQWQDFYETVARPSQCIECGGTKVWWNGTGVRSASVLVDGLVVYLDEVRCRRARCARCGKSWTIRPPGLLPHRHYQLCVVAEGLGSYLFDASASLSSVASRLDCSARTVTRWRDWVAALAEPALLERLTARASGAPLLSRLLPVAEVERKGRSQSRRGVLERAALVLGLLEALGCAWGCEPPGLRAVLDLTVGDRAGMTTGRRPTIPELAFRQASRSVVTMPL